MKIFNPYIMHLERFAAAFPLCHAQFTRHSVEGLRMKGGVLVTMPKADVRLCVVSTLSEGDYSRYQEVDISRTGRHGYENLVTFYIVRLAIPVPCVILHSVAYEGSDDPGSRVRINLTETADLARQADHFKRALKLSLFFDETLRLLGPNPEQARSLSTGARQRLMHLTLPPDLLHAQIEQMPLPENYPRRDEFTLQGQLTGFLKEEFEGVIAAQEKPAIGEAKPRPVTAPPAPATGPERDNVVSLDRFRARRLEKPKGPGA